MTFETSTLEINKHSDGECKKKDIKTNKNNDSNATQLPSEPQAKFRKTNAIEITWHKNNPNNIAIDQSENLKTSTTPAY